ncbi:MAG: putative transcriptional regulator [Natronomonas sp.]
MRTLLIRETVDKDTMGTMASLLPERTVDGQEATPECISLTDSDEILDALSSDTARKVLAALHEEPAPASDLAERVETSLQNVNHHLAQLQSAGLIDNVDTWYSTKGREMDVYAPTNQPLVMVAGESGNEESLRRWANATS